ncbi:MAG: hypothetical protein PHC90_00085 [Syntrophorhabdaceae bacterium]|nr:hypothetical protein [Syntrophorhabdaceae bacterium]
MPKIAPRNLEPGMKTARSVVNTSGMVLLGENTELTPELIDRIRNMDVDGVYVHGSLKPSTPLETALENLDRRFLLVGDQPLMNIIKNAARKHIEGLYE